MKPSPMLCACVCVMLAWANGAFAGANLNNSKSNISGAADPNAPSAGAQGQPSMEADCARQGGQVETAQDGTKRCTTASRAKTICLVYMPNHEGDSRYCSQSVPAP